MPADTTPDPRDMERAPEAQRIPQAREGPSEDARHEPDIFRRPRLPEDPQIMAADVARDPAAAPTRDVTPGLGESDSELNRG